MPVFNAAPFLNECILSIQEQSYSQWELIAVDDFSTDNSYQTLTEFSRKDERIHVTKNQDKGIIQALRKAFSESKGDYLTRMDADDIMLPKKLEALAHLVEDGTVITGKVEYFRDFGDLGSGYTRYANWLNELVDNDSHWNFIYKECVIPSPAWMMTRRTLESLQAFDASTYPEDYDLIFRCYKAGLRVKSTPDIIHSWRDHPQRASRNDPNYADNRFLDIKLKYFLEIDHEMDSVLVLWGAGAKGKYIAKHFVDHKVPFMWVTENEKKLKAPIYNIQLQSIGSIPSESDCIISVAAPADQLQIKEKLKHIHGITTYWFC